VSDIDMDDLGDANFGTLAILVWLLLAARLLQLVLVPALLLVARGRLRGLAPRWIGHVLAVVALGLFASFAASLLTFHVVQRWVYEFSVNQLGILGLLTSVLNYSASIGLAVAILGLVRTVQQTRCASETSDI
jgi:hypothetical protein